MTRKKQVCSGRSMIEMLGVLAIIGVLSAGGIMGYSSAMENYKVNKFMEMVAMSEAQKEIAFAEMPKETGDFVYDTQELCDLHIIPAEICSKSSSMGENYRTGYFGENIRIFLQQYTTSGTYATIKTLDGESVVIYKPISHLQFFTYSAIPFSACTKILINKNWQKIGQFSILAGRSTGAGNHELPLTTDEAISVCTKITAYSGNSLEFGVGIFTVVSSAE